MFSGSVPTTRLYQGRYLTDAEIAVFLYWKEKADDAIRRESEILAEKRILAQSNFLATAVVSRSHSKC
jgi:hypothetical protein